MNPWANQSVLITGVCGTVGSELLRQLKDQDCERILGMDNNESDLFFLTQAHVGRKNVHLFIGDLRDQGTLTRKMRGVDLVLHAAALKHVILCEESPRDAVQTNVGGIANVIDGAVSNRVKRLLFTSSDKAVNPTNVMGATKLMGERLVTAAYAHGQDENDTVFTSTRFGNVLGSRGSVVPLFKRQIRAGGPVTLTDAGMTRFVMTLEEAARLVLESVFMARGGEVFVTKMPVIRIADLAEVMIEQLAPRFGFRAQDIEIKVIGAKAGEKHYEELLNEEEIRRTVELDRFFSILPAFRRADQPVDYAYEGMSQRHIDKPYNSALEPAMTRDQLADYLLNDRILEETH